MIIIEIRKLIDKEADSISLFHLMKELIKFEHLNTENKTEIAIEEHTLRDKYTRRHSINLHRNKRKAHSSKDIKPDLEKYLDLKDIHELLNLSEELIKKYSKWMGKTSYSINFDSIYANGNEDLLKYISKIKF